MGAVRNFGENAPFSATSQRTVSMRHCRAGGAREAPRNISGPPRAPWRLRPPRRLLGATRRSRSRKIPYSEGKSLILKGKSLIREGESLARKAPAPSGCALRPRTAACGAALPGRGGPLRSAEGWLWPCRWVPGSATWLRQVLPCLEAFRSHRSPHGPPAQREEGQSSRKPESCLCSLARHAVTRGNMRSSSARAAADAAADVGKKSSTDPRKSLRAGLGNHSTGSVNDSAMPATLPRASGRIQLCKDARPHRRTSLGAEG